MEAEPTWLQRFWNKVTIPSDLLTECWMWKGKPDQDGYGLLRMHGTNMRAHRLMWMLFNKQPLPKNKPHVLHSCDTPLCVSPFHLRAGTPAENNLDKKLRKRGLKRLDVCNHGHPRTPENYRPYPSLPDVNVCHPCKNEQSREKNTKRRQAREQQKWQQAVSA